MEYTSKYTMAQPQFIYFLIHRAIVTLRTERKRNGSFLEMEVTIMMRNRIQCASAVLVLVMTLCATSLWAHEHHASLAALQTSTQEALREAWLNPGKEGSLFTQNGLQLFRSGEPEGLNFELGGMAGTRSRTRPVPQVHPDVSVNIRPDGISTPDLGAAGIPLWKW